MSTLNDLINGADSDSDDGDFVPDAGNDSDSSVDRPKKRARTSPTPAPSQVEDEQAKEAKRSALWASFQKETVDNPASDLEKLEKNKMVKIQRKYRFAGEDFTEMVEVRADSEDAKKWPLAPADSGAADASAPDKAIVATSLATPVAPITEAVNLATTPAKRPLARKPRPKKSLSAMAAETAPAKKLTTLEKSRLDWNSHLHQAPSDLKEEIEANRKGGGYLEKVDFLERVGERKEKMIEQEKAKKKR